ncbi:hypothetical protein H4R19_004031 [Coemansia spiralis]|nr:hypothetical protein H4R19_004031 [Coemansia spiralis]
MTVGVYETRGSRQSVGSAGSGSRRHSLLSVDGSGAGRANYYDYAMAWNAHGDKLSGWRQAYIASATGDSDGVQSTSLALPDTTRFTTSLAMSEDQPLVAVGSGSYETNMFFVQTLDDQLDVKASFASKFPIYSLAFKSNLLMAGTDRSTSVLYKVDRARLLGYADAEGESDPSGPMVKCVGTYKNKAPKSMDAAAPGTHMPTRRVACVEFAPVFGSGSSGWPPASVGAGSELFLACLGGVVNIWDATRNQQALRMEKLSAQPLACAAWSPHAAATLVAAAGVDGTVSVVDLRRRGRAVAWRAGAVASAGSVAAASDIAWSPFAPYWLASAGESGEAAVWDLRYTASAVTLRHPTNHGALRSLAWSATHADMLATGTSDRSWWLHSLSADGAEPAVVRASVVADKRSADDIGAVVALRAKGSTFYALSSCGDLYAHRVTPAAMAQTTVYRLASPAERQVEAAVYARDLRGAAEAVLQLVQTMKEDGRGSGSGDGDDKPGIVKHAESIRRLCELFKAKARIAHASWAFPKLASAIDDQGSGSGSGSAAGDEAERARGALAADLGRLAYGLPPDFPLEATAARQPVVWQALELLNMANLRIRLGRMVEAADAADGDGPPPWKTVAERERQIMQYVRAEPELFDAKLLRAVVKLVLPHDCVAGLTLGLGVCQAYLAAQRQHEARSVPSPVTCAMLDGLVHVLLFPTVFDTDASNTGSGGETSDMASRELVTPTVPLVRERLRECLEVCPELVFEMVRLEISIQETVVKGSEQKRVAEEIVRIVHAHAQSMRVLLDNTGTDTTRALIQIQPMFPATTTLSASAVRLYLNSLLSTRNYDEHLVNTQWWRAPPPPNGARPAVIGTDRGWPSSFPLARMLNRQAAVAIVPRLQRQMDVVLATIRKEPLGLEPRLYRDTLLKVAKVSLLMQCDQPLEFSVDVASKDKTTGGTLATRQHVCTSLGLPALADAFDEIGNAFLMLLEALTRHSSHRDAYKRAAAEAQPLHESLAGLLAAAAAALEHTRDKPRIMAVRKYLRKLDHYAKAEPQ